MNDWPRVQSDPRAVMNDWPRVGSDLRAVILDQRGGLIDPFAELIDHLGGTRVLARVSIVRDARASFVDFLTVSVDAA